MGGLTGFLTIGVAVAVIIVMNNLARRRVRRMNFDQNNQWVIDPQTGRPVPAPPGQHHQGHHPGGGFLGGGHHGGGHGGGLSGGGHHGGGGGGGDGGGGGGHHG